MRGWKIRTKVPWSVTPVTMASKTSPIRRLHGNRCKPLGHVALDFFGGVFFFRTVGRDGG